MYTFGKNSNLVLKELHQELQLILIESLKRSKIDFSLVQGHRSPKVQFEYYKKGRALKNNKWVVVDEKKVITNIDGYKIKGKHNYKPSLAVDIMAYIPGKPTLAYDKVHLAYLGAVIEVTADDLKSRGIIKHSIR